MTPWDQLQRRVAAAYDTQQLPVWADPHAGVVEPAAEEYSRVTEAHRYGIGQARARAWRDVLAEVPGVSVETIQPGTGHAGAVTYADQRCVRLGSSTPGTLALILLEQDVLLTSGEGILPVVRIAVERPDLVLEAQPACGCDACDSGSLDLVNAVDEAIRRIVEGPLVVLRGDGWGADWSPGSASSYGAGPAAAGRRRGHEDAIGLCQQLAAGDVVRLPSDGGLRGSVLAVIAERGRRGRSGREATAQVSRPVSDGARDGCTHHALLEFLMPRHALAALAAPALFVFIAHPAAVHAATERATPTCGGHAATIVGTAGNDVLRGTSHADVIVARGGNDTVRGGGGNDIICGGSGRDHVYGGPGRDRVFGGSGDDAIAAGDGSDVVIGGVGDDDELGGSGDDVLNGNADDDSLGGGLGSDILRGGDGSDELDGDEGDDTLSGGQGDDSLSDDQGENAEDGGDGSDTCVSAAGDSCDDDTE